MPRPTTAVLTASLFVLAPLAGCSVSFSYNDDVKVEHGIAVHRVADVESAVATHTIASPNGVVRIRNLAGSVNVVPADGDDLIIKADIRAKGATDVETAALLSRMKWIEITDDGTAMWSLDWPTDRHDTFHYSTDGEGFKMVAKKGFDRPITVTTAMTTGAPTLSADITVFCPTDAALYVKTYVGDVDTASIDGDLELRTIVGGIDVEGSDGTLVADTWSGDITVDSATGTVDLDTGSGEIRVATLEADGGADTGSGNIVITSADCSSFDADTGSGSIAILGGTVGDLVADTGSGNIEFTGEFDTLDLDTGSGDISIRTSMSDASKILADTGSGNVTIIAGRHASFDLDMDTGSGTTTVAFDDAKLRYDDDEIVGARRGDGRTDIEVDTGSGDITVKPGE